MCILQGFPSIPNKSATTVAAPFGIWFANATTIYVADEGDGYAGGPDLYTHAAAQKTAGLQKWVLNVFGNVVLLWAPTSTVSGSGNQGADPNQLVVIADFLKNTDPAVAAKVTFFPSRKARFGEVLRGVSLTPGTGMGDEGKATSLKKRRNGLPKLR